MRIHQINNKPVNRKGNYVLYWMIGARRTRYNHALDRVSHWCEELGVPCLVFEPLRLDYEYASERIHSFLLEGMADNAQKLDARNIAYLPFLEPQVGAGKGLLEALAQDAALVITDWTPVFFLPKMVKAAGRKLPLRLEAVDSVGLLPLGLVEKTYPAAVHFRRFFQKNFSAVLSESPLAETLDGLNSFGRAKIPETVFEKWGGTSREDLGSPGPLLEQLPLDHHVKRGVLVGGPSAAQKSLDQFVRLKLPGYEEGGNHPDLSATSQLSAYLHFGHIGAYEIFARVAEAENWVPENISQVCKGQRSGWWGMSASAEAFLDQLVTWRELSQSWALLQPEWHRFDLLPGWAIETLELHEDDPRVPAYTLHQLENATTHDALWNAAQTQLLSEGLLHGYLRMYWGKMIVAWTPSVQEALQRMLYLNDKFALDGRDPNSVSGCTWCVGRFDRPWWPERDVFGKVRYMSGKNILRKIKCKRYLEKYQS